MSDSSSASKGGIAGWLKAAIATVFSAISGAALMYASPLLDTIIKPAKPVANFQAQTSGLTVTFQNKSTGGHDGWWDFGDGSALEPFVSAEPAITHAFAKAGSYTVKLSLKNLINEENERAATVTLDASTAQPKLPSIDTFQVVPVSGDYAPAAFRVVSEVKNADMCVWVLGNRQVEFSPEAANGKQQRIVTFQQPGTHVLRLAAFNGSQTVEKSETVIVKKAPVGMVAATVTVTYEAVHLQQRARNQFVSLQFPAQQNVSVATVSRAVKADPGFEFTQANVVQPNKDASIKSAKVQIDPAKRDTALVTCEILKPTKPGPVPTSTVQVALTQQHQSLPKLLTPEPVSVFLAMPGATPVPLPPLPQGWLATKHKITLTLQQDGKQIAVYDGTMPQNAPVPVPGASGYALTAVEQQGQLQVTVGPKGGIGVHGN